jgi:hypothetical protein
MSEESKPVHPTPEEGVPEAAAAPESSTPEAAAEAPEPEATDAGDVPTASTESGAASPGAALNGESQPQTPDPAGPGEDDIWTDDIEVAPTPSISPGSPTLGADDAADWNLEDVNWTAPAPPPPPPSEPGAGVEFITQVKQLVGQGQRLWYRLLAGVRSRLPVTAQWSDSLLGGVLVGILLLLLTLANGLSGSPSAAQPIVEAAPAPLAAEAATTDADDLTPDGDSSAGADPAVIGEVQAQLTEAATFYGEGLVQSVQVNLSRSRLTVNLSQGWYRLGDKAQTDLVADLQQRSRTLAFDTLEVRSPDDSLLARSPVVGDTMVILQRQPLPEVPQPERPRYRLLID